MSIRPHGRAEGVWTTSGDLCAKRGVPYFDDLLFSASAWRDRSRATARQRHRRHPLHPLRRASLLSSEIHDHHRRDELRRALGVRQGGPRRGATAVGTCTTTGDGGMLPEEREHSEQARLPDPSRSRYGMNPTTCAAPTRSRSWSARAPSPAEGGMLWQKISDRVAEMPRSARGRRPAQRLPHPDWTGPDDLEIKIGELLRRPIGASRSSTPRSAPPAPTSTSPSRSRPAPT